MKILSFDPGYGRLGTAVIEKNGSKEILIYSDCFTTESTKKPEERLLLLSKEIRRLIDEYEPDGVALEKLFFAKNQKTALRVAEVRGIIIESAAEKSLKVFEYGPTEIKVAITGYGRSSKDQVISMVKKLIKIDKDGALDDEFDAVAVGLACFAYEKFR